MTGNDTFSTVTLLGAVGSLCTTIAFLFRLYDRNMRDQIAAERDRANKAETRAEASEVRERETINRGETVDELVRAVGVNEANIALTHRTLIELRDEMRGQPTVSTPLPSRRPTRGTGGAV